MCWVTEPVTLDCVGDTGARSGLCPEQAAASKMASVFLVSGSPLRQPRGPDLAGPARPRDPARHARRQWKAATGLPRPCRPRRAPSDLDLGTERCRPRGDGARSPFGLRLCPGSRNHGAADWLGDMAGASRPWLYAALSCRVIDAVEPGVCDVIPAADQ